ncbi:hypothetical protein [Mesorhizobium sp. YR577]|uniref:hypothetical protein n=1 Tax=Mesorhizobium sp. YR577 TaxID=1884373 RepID=UPI0008E4067B|nr:hypothetical protein [Mesorhizobium sp. YR577]SFU22140.1 hypothetical protein SAMN05518861_1327 [Mesorhizobium sp. YR577]
MTTNNSAGRRVLAWAIVGAAMLAAHSARADTISEVVGDWTASVEDVNTGQDQRKTCTATASAKDPDDTAWTLKVSISDGDVLPPEAYPAVTVSAEKGDFPEGEGIPAVFDVDGTKVEVTVLGEVTDTGHQWVMENDNDTSQALFAAMNDADAVTFELQDSPVASLPVGGFDDAYRQLGEWCGFPTDDVAPAE